MIDALGEPQSVVVLGGTSDIGRAIVRALGTPRLERVVLAGRPSPALDQAASGLAVELDAELGSSHAPRGPRVATVTFDALETATHGEVVDALFDAGDVDVVVLAFGVLGSQHDAESRPAEAVHVAQVNYVGAVSVGLHLARRLRHQGHGVLVVLSSVAGDRPRRSNFVYGSSKAGLDAFAQGLGDALHGSGARVLVVRPGFVRSRMTAGRPAQPLAVDPADVATAVVEGIRRSKHTVYVPARLRLVMAALRSTPRGVFRRLPL